MIIALIYVSHAVGEVFIVMVEDGVIIFICGDFLHCLALILKNILLRSRMIGSFDLAFLMNHPLLRLWWLLLIENFVIRVDF
jgi:hypothetical protein